MFENKQNPQDLPSQDEEIEANASNAEANSEVSSENLQTDANSAEVLEPNQAPDAGDGVVMGQGADDLQDEVLRLTTQVNALKEQYLRERAENENLRKRQERELVNAHKFATERLIKDLFPVLDSLGLGLLAAQENSSKNPDNAELKQFVEGLEMTSKILSETLAKNGVSPIAPAKGEKFDPETQEAIAMFPNPESENNTVFELSQVGYSLNGRVVRAAKVVVVKNS